jgi:hypothetical protein
MQISAKRFHYNVVVRVGRRRENDRVESRSFPKQGIHV